MSSYPDVQMQSVLDHIRRYSKTENQTQQNSEPDFVRSQSPMVASAISRRQSNDILMNDVTARRLSEAGVNRRPSAALVLTEDTDSFIVGDRVYVDGIKPGRIQFIGKTIYFLLLDTRVTRCQSGFFLSQNWPMFFLSAIILQSRASTFTLLLRVFFVSFTTGHTKSNVQ